MKKALLKIGQNSSLVLNRFWRVGLITLLVLVIGLLNHKPNTWLIGWDSYTPNLNFSANFERNVFGVWQEERGLGLLDGLSHTANLVHSGAIWILSFVLPDNTLRYVFHLVMLWLGGIGMYQLASSLLKKNASLISSLFYILNVGTIQMFHLPLEVFSVHFAGLPWLTLALLKFLETPSKRAALFLFVCSFLSSPQGYVPTVFLVYLLSVFFIFIGKILYKKSLKNAFLALLIIFISNAFWTLPYCYSFVKNVNVISQSKINVMSNEDIRQNNLEYGDFKSTAQLQGLYLSFVDQDDPQHITYVMEPWRNHLNNTTVQVIVWAFFIISIIGIGHILLSKNKALFPFVYMFVFCFLLLGSKIPYLSEFSSGLNTHVPIFSNAYRFVFTKFSILYAFSYSILLGSGLIFLTSFHKSLKLFHVLIGIGIILSVLPAFKGHLFYGDLQVAIPNEYHQLIRFFETRDHNQRIHILPQTDFWGWTYYSWGFKGSGFVWQGIPQATMDGAFLPWSIANENYYLESSTALHSNDLPKFEEAIEKYKINWVVLDENVVGNHELLKRLLESSPKLIKTNTFGNLSVFKTEQNEVAHDFLYSPKKIVNAIGASNYTRSDSVYQKYGDYVSYGSEMAYFPFSDLSSERPQLGISYQESDDENQILITRKLELTEKKSQLAIPHLDTYQIPIVVRRDRNRAEVSFLYPYQMKIGDQLLFNDELAKLDFDLPNDNSQFLITINGQQLFLNSERTQTFSVRMTLNENLNIELFEVRSENNVLVATPIEQEIPSVTEELWSKVKVIENEIFEINSAESITAAIITPKISTDLSAASFSHNCDIFQRGLVSKETISSGVIYRSNNRGSFCDYFGFDDLSHQSNYLLRVKGVNDTKKGLQFSVKNWVTNYNDLDMTLDYSSFDSTYTLLSQPFIQGNGYSINFKLSSFLNSSNQSQLNNLEMYSVPIEALTQIAVGSPKALNQRQNNLEILDVKKQLPFWYWAKVYGKDGQSTLALLQSYDSGWIALSVKNPLVFLPHYQFNGWANAWEVPAGEYDVVIFYWPQLLMFTGVILLISTFFVLVRGITKKQHIKFKLMSRWFR